MLINSRKLALAIAAVLLLPIESIAAPIGSGWYLGGGIGQADHDIGDADAEGTAALIADVISFIDPDVVFNSYKLDNKDTAWKLLLGYEVNRNFAVEAFWANLGEATLTVSGVDTFFPAPVSASLSVEAKGFGIAAIGKVPLGIDGAMFGKIGMFMWDADATAAYNHSLLGSASESAGSDDGSDPVVGFGYQHNFGQASARIEWERYMDISDIDIDVIWVNGLIRF